MPKMTYFEQNTVPYQSNHIYLSIHTENPRHHLEPRTVDRIQNVHGHIPPLGTV